MDLLRSRGYQITRGGLTVRLAQQFGFCVGVERAVQMAYEARQKFPGKRTLHHRRDHPQAFVNKKLDEMGFIFLKGPYASGMSYDDITADDVVILPAFGAPVSEIRKIQEKGAFIVDTTCGAVINVWNNVQKYAREGFTSVNTPFPGIKLPIRLYHGYYKVYRSLREDVVSSGMGKADTIG